MLPVEGPECTCGGCDSLGEACLYCCPGCCAKFQWQAGIFRDPSGRTCLMIAAGEGFLEGVKLLVSKEKGMATSTGLTALQEARRGGNEEIIKILEAEVSEIRALGARQDDETINFNFAGDKEQNRVAGKDKTHCYCSKYLKQAVYNECTNCTKRLIYQAGQKDAEGRTALMLAANAGFSQIVEILVAKEAGIQAGNGNTALIFAAQHNRQECVRVLLPYEHGLKNDKGKTALAQVLSVKNFALAQLMFSDAIEVAATNKRFFEQAIRMGCRLPQDVYAKIRAREEASLDEPQSQDSYENFQYYSQDQDHSDAPEEAPEESSHDDYQYSQQSSEEEQCGVCLNLLHAARRNCVPCTRKYLHLAGEVSDDKYEQTAMMIAAYKGFAEIVEILAPREAGIVSAYGETALMQAAKGGSMEVVKVLAELEAGIRSSRGVTARRFAEMAGNEAVAQYLARFEK